MGFPLSYRFTACSPLPFKENQGFELFVGFCMCAIVLFLLFPHLLVSLLYIWVFQADVYLQHECEGVQLWRKAIPFPLFTPIACAKYVKNQSRGLLQK